MQKTIALYHNRKIDMIKLDYTLPKLANICLHKTADSKLHPFTEWDENIS